MRCLILIAGLFGFVGGSAPLVASDDGLWLRAPLGSVVGSWELGVQSQLVSQESWRENGGLRMLDPDGQVRQTRSLQLLTTLRWQAQARHGFELLLPYKFVEHGPEFPSAGVAPTYAINDPLVNRADAVGDLGLAWRWAAWQSKDAKGQADLGLGAGVRGPTGQSPWSGAHPRVATGEGVWMGNCHATLLGQRDKFFSGVQGSIELLAGSQAEISGNAPYAYTSSGPLVYPSGRVYIEPRLGGEIVALTGWDWHVDESARHSLGLELRQHWRAPLVVEGIALDASRESEQVASVWMRFRFLPRFTLLAAYLSAPFNARGIAASDDGSTLLRAEVVF